MPFCAAVLALSLLVAPSNARGPTPLLEPLVRVSSAAARPPNYKVREIIIQADPDRECPNGFEQTGGNCLQVDSLPATSQCPPGWQMSDDGQQCFGFTAVLPEHTCDEGKPNYRECVIEKTSPKVMSCPTGYSLSNDLRKCVRELSHVPRDVCEPGARYANGICITVTTEMPRLRCPGEHVLEHGECHRAMETAPIVSCPPGYTRTGKDKGCSKTVVKKPSQRCPTGFVIIGLDCISETHIPPTMICTKGEMIEGNRCLIKQTTAPHLECRKAMQVNPISGLCEKDDVKPPMAECTKGTLYNPVTNQCGSVHKLKQPNLACPPNYRFVGKTHCVKHISEMPEKACPPGFELISKDQCVHKDIVLPEARCPPGSQFMGNLCGVVHTAPYDLICDKGTVLEGKNCVAKAHTEVLRKCPPPFAMSDDGRCLSSVTAPPTPVCPPDTLQRADAAGLVCLVSSETPALPTCPTDQEVRSNECVERIYASPTAVCPPGYFEDLAIGRCFKSEVLPRRTFCPVGYNLVGGKCLKKEVTPPLPTCPPGYQATSTQQGYICTKETTAPFINICAMGFQYDNGICIAKKLQYEFDEKPLEAPAPEAENPEEAQKPLQTPDRSPSDEEPQTEAQIEITVNRPVVQKGLVMRNEPVILSGPASEVARQQAILNAGGDVSSDVKVEYIPPNQGGNGANLGALMSALGRTLFGL